MTRNALQGTRYEPILPRLHANQLTIEDIAAILVALEGAAMVAHSTFETGEIWNALARLRAIMRRTPEDPCKTS